MEGKRYTGYIEAIQRMFTNKITEVQHLNYWERLHKLKLYSLQRRRGRYIIIYILKIIQYRWYNGHKIKTRNHPWHGTQCVIACSTNRNPPQSLQENAITVFGPHLFNSLTKYLRDIGSVKTEKLKFEVDKFLELLMSPKCQLCHRGKKQQHPRPTISSKSSRTLPRRWQSQGLNCYETTPSIPSK